MMPGELFFNPLLAIFCQLLSQRWIEARKHEYDFLARLLRSGEDALGIERFQRADRLLVVLDNCYAAMAKRSAVASMAFSIATASVDLPAVGAFEELPFAARLGHESC
jgi:hypothetical protein